MRKKIIRFRKESYATIFKPVSGRRNIRPPVLQYRELIHVLGNIERDLKVIAMKEELADKDRIFIMQKLADLNDTFAGRFYKEI